jgi:hypothetical protein
MKTAGLLVKIETAVFILCLGYFTCLAGMVGYAAITDPDPNHCRETSPNLLALMINQGENPYELKNLPGSFSTYGPLFYVVTAPFAGDIEASRLSQRIFSVVSVFAFAALFSLTVCRHSKKSLDWLIAFACGLLSTYFIFFSNEFGSKPGNFGLLLAFACFALPYLSKYSYKGILFGLFLGMLAILVKMYYAYAPVLLLVYLFCFVDKLKAVLCGIAFAFIMAAGLGLLELFLPNSISIILSPRFFLAHSYQVAFGRLAQFASAFAPVLILAALVSLTWIYCAAKGGFRLKNLFEFNLLELRKPLFAYEAVPFSLYLTVGVFAVYMKTLAGHTGNGLIYVSHTFLPYLFWFVIESIQKTYRHSINNKNICRQIYLAAMPLIMVQMLLLWGGLDRQYDNYAQSFAKDWALIEKYLKHSQNTLGNRLTSFAEMKLGKTPHEYGQTEFAIFITSERYPDYKKHIEDYYAAIKNQVARGEFDLIILMDAKTPEQSFNTYVKAKFVMQHGYAPFKSFPLNTTIYKNLVHLFVKKSELAKWQAL